MKTSSLFTKTAITALANVVSFSCIALLALTPGQTLAVSLGSQDGLQINATFPRNHTTAPRAQEHSNGRTLDFDCPLICSCHYEASTQHLKISCQHGGSTVSPIPRPKLSLSNGVRHLGINHATLNSFTIPKIIPRLPEANLIELSLHNVILDPLLLLSSDLIIQSKKSLRKIRICDGVSGRTDYLLTEARDRLPHFFSLETLDSLTLCDNEPRLSQLLLNALPAVTKHITVTNSSVTELGPALFSHLDGLESLNLSRNHIKSIPWGLLQPLSSLRQLDLSQNRIEHLQEEVFLGLYALHKLNVSNNMIRYVDTEVFNPLTAIHTIDLSQNEVIQIFDPYFTQNGRLKVLLMKNTWAKDSFVNSYTASRSLMEMDRLIDTLQFVETLDLRDNNMRTIPESLAHLPHLRRVYLDGNQWDCRCQDRWVQHWASTTKMSIDNSNDTKQIMCHSNSLDYQFSNFMQSLNCTNPNIVAKTPKKYYGIMSRNLVLHCHTQNAEGPAITWINPQKQRLVTGSRFNEPNPTDLTAPSYLRVLKNGNLYMSNLTLDDFGLYVCIASYPGLNITHYVHLGMDTSIFLHVKFYSILVGWATSLGFLLTVLIAQLVRHILSSFGLDCPDVSGAYKTRRIRAFFENMEQHKNTQLEWLRDNYNMQAKRIKDNCISQVERIRDSYTTQTKNLSDIRDYGAQQIHTMRDQYHDQIRRVSSYSTHQLCKVRENYVFQRNRVGKFSSHQLLRLRETYKWQAQTLNKILENLPKTLNFDTCRGIGACGRTESIYMDEMGEPRPDCILLDPSQLYMGDGPGHSKAKLEHISLLIPPEFFLASPEEKVHAFPMSEGSCSYPYPTVLEGDEEADAENSSEDEEDLHKVNSPLQPNDNTERA